MNWLNNPLKKEIYKITCGGKNIPLSSYWGWLIVFHLLQSVNSKQKFFLESVKKNFCAQARC